MQPIVTFCIVTAVLLACFWKQLAQLLQLAWAEELHSHIPLIPFISAYLVWTRRAELPLPGPKSAISAASGLVLGGALLAIPALFSLVEPFAILSIRLLALLAFLASAVSAIFGTRFAKAVAFPLAFLVFAVPLPPAIINVLEIASQHSSAEVYSWIMDLTQSSYYRDGLRFALPGLNIQVAQECSGIRSSYVLCIVSLLAGNLFLNSPWRRLALALFVIPLGIVRNGFRIFVLSFLSVHWDKSVIDSPLHHKGGPIFFALSLIPFAIFLLWLCRAERKARHNVTRSVPTR